MSIDNTLQERGTRYGEFSGHARITQRLKLAMHLAPKWEHLEPDQKEALEMVAHKIGRILNGDPDYLDSWHDIIGYTRLVEQRLEKRQHNDVNATFAKTLEEIVAAQKAPGVVSGTNQAQGCGPEAEKQSPDKWPADRLIELLRGADHVEVVFLGASE